jgi:uncharacterized HhH-GPD family protein
VHVAKTPSRVVRAARIHPYLSIGAPIVGDSHDIRAAAGYFGGMAIDTSTYHHPESLELTRDPDANRLVAQDAAALVIGWICDQQVRVQQAFHAPIELGRRLGTLAPTEIAAMPSERVVDAFVEHPPLHRYGRSMGMRVHACMQLIRNRYDGDAERIWLEAADYDDLRERLLELPGFGMTKVPAFTAMLVRRFGLQLEGYEDGLPSYGCLADVETYDDLLAYQARKHEWRQAHAEVRREPGVRRRSSGPGPR